MEKNKKRANFERIAEQRTNKILILINSLKNLKNTSFYDYEKEDLKAIIKAINEGIQDLEAYYFNKRFKKAFKLPAKEPK